MANQISVTGNLGADPRVNVGDFGTVLNFGLAYRPRKKDKQSGEWVDAGPTLWFDVSVWGDMAEYYADRVHKGSRVTVTGTLGSREHDGKTYTTVRADSLSVETPRSTAQANTATSAQTYRAPSSPAADPWATVPDPTDEPQW